MLEGQAFAARLAGAGVPVTLAVDAAGYDVVREANVLLVGADSLTQGGVVGKVGTAGLALAAQKFGVLAFVLADRAKIWPAMLGTPVIRERAGEEVWDEAPRAVRVRNHYFDTADWSAFAGVITESGIVSSDEVLAEGKAMRVHDSLTSLYEKLAEGLR
jgi:translation initiation factor 2B subunit (eIF-2B alpha/beta/delta family)